MSEIGKSIIRGLQQALEYAEGSNDNVVIHKIEVPDEIDVRKIRKSLRMSREEFAGMFGFSVRTLEKWELGRTPSGPLRAYLTAISNNPEAVSKAVRLPPLSDRGSRPHFF